MAPRATQLHALPPWPTPLRGQRPVNGPGVRSRRPQDRRKSKIRRGGPTDASAQLRFDIALDGPHIVLEEGADECQAIRYPEKEPLELLHDRRYIINVGSVGQPRDRDPRAAYVWYDDEADVVRLRRLTYPIDAVQQKILDAGLPPFLAQRLADGV